MKWVLIIMVFSPFDINEIAVSFLPHEFRTELECKAFVKTLREQHENKRIDASCIAVTENDSKNNGGQK